MCRSEIVYDITRINAIATSGCQAFETALNQCNIALLLMIMRCANHFCIALVVGMGRESPANHANTLTVVMGYDADPLG